jgi:Domain of unknown function (DUF4838)/Glycosyl hydrolase family 67 N-terminus
MLNSTHIWIQNGRPVGQIVLAYGASEQEEFAAEELAAYLKKMSGGSMPIKHGLRKRDKASIVILDASRPANRKFLTKLPVCELQDDGFLIQSVGDDLFIVSEDSFGIVFGTYQYLRRVLGCRFLDYAPHGEDIPSTETVQHDAVSILKNPKLSYRGMQMAHSIRRIDWMAKNGFNWLRVGNDNDLDWWDTKLEEMKPHFRKRGIRMNFGHHMFHMILPRRLYEQDHPDYFPQEGDGQFHWSLKNPSVLDEVIWRLEKFLRRHPEIEKFDFWPTDGLCKIDAEDYRVATGEDMPDDDGEWRENVAGVTEWARLGNPHKEAIYAALAKKVADALGPKFPDLEIVLAAYADLTQPSKRVLLPENITATIAMYWRCYRHSIFDDGCIYNDQYRQIIQEWAEMYPGRSLYLSEYYMGMGVHVSLPYPIITTLFREWPDLIELGIVGGKVNTGRSVDTAVVPYNINYLAFQSIVWGDAQHAEEFIGEYCKDYFGDAWQEMAEMYLLWEDRVQHAQDTQPGMVHFNLMFDRDTLARSRELVDSALAVAKAENLRYRIQRVGRLVDYASKALPISHLLWKRRACASDSETSTEQIDKELGPLLQEMVEYYESLIELDQDIIGYVRPTSLMREGDVKVKRSPWERQLAKIRKEAWVGKEFDPNILQARGG